MKMDYSLTEKGFYTSIDQKKEFAFYLNLKSGVIKPTKITEVLDQTIEIQDVAIINYISKDDDGNPVYNDDGTPKMKHRLILITPTRKCYTTASEHLFWQFISFTRIIGFPSWEDGVVSVKVVRKDIGEGKFRFDFEVM